MSLMARQPSKIDAALHQSAGESHAAFHMLGHDNYRSGPGGVRIMIFRRLFYHRGQ